MKVLYAGDSPVGGAANYLLGILRLLGASVRHLPPTATLHPRWLATTYDAIVLSDIAAGHVPQRSQRAIAQQVAQGTGLLMVGGWASFSGSMGGWRGSLIERLLPITCLRGDDRVHLPGGALILPGAAHPTTAEDSFRHPPVICGLNAVHPKPRGRVVLRAQPIIAHPGRLALGRSGYPVLIVDADPRTRLAAFATDLAPHWCGGLVDWGVRRLRLSVTDGMQVEVGDRYVRFVSRLLRWLARSV